MNELRHGDLFCNQEMNGPVFMIIWDGKHFNYSCIGTLSKSDTDFASIWKGNLVQLPYNTWNSSEVYIGNIMDIFKRCGERHE